MPTAAAVTDLPLPRFACPDWWERIQAGETPMADVPLDEARAARALAFFNRLRLPDVSGTPPLSQACGAWFRDILTAMLASKDPDTGARVVEECLCMVPKKNSKTTYTAAFALTALYMEEAPRSQMLLIGPSQNISDRCFEQAQGMIRLDPLLDKVFMIQDSRKRITYRRTGTRLEVKTFDTNIVTGEIPVMTIIDELHELGKKAAALSVMQQIRGGGITKKGGQVMMITTQSDKAPAGIWKSELDKARAIRAGSGGRTPILLPVLYEFPEEKQRDEAFWRNTDNWPLVLPNLGRSIDGKRLTDDYENNGMVSPEAERIWMSQHLNIQIGLGLHDSRWAGADWWEAAAHPGGLTLEDVLARSEVCTVGIDPGGLDDLLGLAVLGRERGTGDWLLWSHAWCDRIVLDRRKALGPALLDFAEDGDLTIVEDMEDDGYPLIVDICLRLRAADLLPDEGAIGIDTAGPAAGLMVGALLHAGFEKGKDMWPVSQGFKLNNVAGSCAVRLKAGSLRHGGTPLMAWAVGNARTEQTKNATLVTKAESGMAKIDPLMALFDAAELLSFHPEAGRGGAVSIPDDYEMA